MNMITPFSGLSLIIHVLIIGIAKIAKVISKKSGKTFNMPRKFSNTWLQYRGIILPTFSIFIIFFVISIVSVSTTIAMRTGIREGRRDLQLQFISNKYALLANMYKNFSKPNVSHAENRMAISYESDVLRPVAKSLYDKQELPLKTHFNNLIIGGNDFQFKLYEK